MQVVDGDDQPLSNVLRIQPFQRKHARSERKDYLGRRLRRDSKWAGLPREGCAKKSQTAQATSFLPNKVLTLPAILGGYGTIPKLH